MYGHSVRSRAQNHGGSPLPVGAGRAISRARARRPAGRGCPGRSGAGAGDAGVGGRLRSAPRRRRSRTATTTGVAERRAAVEYTRYLLAANRAEIGRADAKASLLLSLAGAVAAVVAGAVVTQPAALSPFASGGLPLWWMGLVLLSWAVVHLLLVVFPRFGRSDWRPGEPITYFGDVGRTAGGRDLGAAMRAAGRDPMPGLLTSLTATSRIAEVKHRHVRRAVICLGGSVVLLTLALLVG